MLVFDTKDQRKPRREPKGDLKAKQKIVGGNIETLPHKDGWNSRFVAYANEEGMIKDLPSNVLAWGVLHYLGFIDSMKMGFYWGNVILLGRNEKALSEKDFAYIEEIRLKYLREMGEEEEEAEADMKTKGKKIKESPVQESELETNPKTKRQKKASD
jgi:hypothetical protein